MFLYAPNSYVSTKYWLFKFSNTPSKLFCNVRFFLGKFSNTPSTLFSNALMYISAYFVFHCLLIVVFTKLNFVFFLFLFPFSFYYCPCVGKIARLSLNFPPLFTSRFSYFGYFLPRIENFFSLGFFLGLHVFCWRIHFRLILFVYVLYVCRL